MCLDEYVAVVFSLNRRANLLAVNRDFSRTPESKSYPTLVNVQHDDFDVGPDRNLFAGFPTEN